MSFDLKKLIEFIKVIIAFVKALFGALGNDNVTEV